MSMEFLEIKDPASLYKVAKTANVVLRIDPLIIVPYYRINFFLDLRKVDKNEIMEIFRILKDKMVLVERTLLEKSLGNFVSKILKEELI